MTGVISRRGAPEAGAIFIKVILDNGSVRLFGPMPGPATDEAGNRRWREVFETGAVVESEADEYLSRQIRFDPDIWIVDIDDAAGTGLL